MRLRFVGADAASPCRCGCGFALSVRMRLRPVGADAASLILGLPFVLTIRRRNDHSARLQPSRRMRDSVVLADVPVGLVQQFLIVVELILQERLRRARYAVGDDPKGRRVDPERSTDGIDGQSALTRDALDAPVEPVKVQTSTVEDRSSPGKPLAIVREFEQPVSRRCFAAVRRSPFHQIASAQERAAAGARAISRPRRRRVRQRGNLRPVS
jgi:hypothetical protein